MLPSRTVDDPSVALVPTIKKTPQALAPFVSITCEPDEVMNVSAVIKTKRALGSPCPSKTKFPPRLTSAAVKQ